MYRRVSYKSPSSVPARPKGMNRFDFEFACKRVIWLEPLLLCAISDLDINFHRAPAPPHCSTPVRQERGCFLTVCFRKFHHTSALLCMQLLAPSTRSFHFLFLSWKLCLVSAPLYLCPHICIPFLLGDPSLYVNKAIYTRLAAWPTKLHYHPLI